MSRPRGIGDASTRQTKPGFLSPTASEQCFGGSDDSIEIYPSVYLSWHWSGALRWGYSHLEESTRQRTARLVRGGVWRDVLLGSFCAGALEASVTSTRGAERLRHRELN